ncbi:MAG TPA: hypothetical protein DIS76_00550 [Rhodospirillaceae bacterium]|nr:hypothetical protein [Rhodospirillaceae bacterium]
MTLAAAQHLQQRASDPTSSVWVSASAGSGKTTVLVSRILRLLLSGILPHRILCLTYTKAAAMEMRLRLSKELTRWATCEATALQRELEKHTGTPPTQAMMDHARSLFAIISDAPDALRIQTIHSFCQSILARFPIEADLSPGFTALDEYQAAPLLRRAMEHAWQENHSETWEKAKNWCTANYSMTQLQDLLPGLMGEWPEISAVMFEIGEADYWAQSFAALNVPENEQEIWRGQMEGAALPMAALRAWLEAKYDADLAEFLSVPDTRIPMRDDYINLFLTGDLLPRKRLLTKEIIHKIGNDYTAMLLAEQERIYALSERAKDQRLATASAAMGIVLARVSTAYQLMKEQHGALDFNDLIQKTHQLLDSRAMGEWVHYKLDGGIDHVLVDEAQDTAPLQWEVITRLVNEFFAGSGRNENTRSLFVVGDPKQSIYSFQGADARVFQHLRESYGQRAAEANASWQDVPMQHSFRTSQNLLVVVDDVFAQPDKRVALQNSDDAIAHATIHDKRMGQIKIYPPIPAPPRQTFSGMAAD